MTEKEYLTLLIAFLAIIVSALVAYFNYRLNKSLNVKNHIFNEKAKLYREITKKIASLISFLQENEISIENPILSKNKIELDRITLEIDKLRNDVDYLLIEAYMLMPEYILNLMREFSEVILDTRPSLSTYTLEEYITSVKNVTQQGENLITEFRKDLQVESINKKLFK